MAQKQCHSCLGLGLIPVITPPMPCPNCHGRGYIEETIVNPVACSCGNHKIQIYQTVIGGWIVYCPNCGNEVSGNIDKDSAIAYWNSKN